MREWIWSRVGGLLDLVSPTSNTPQKTKMQKEEWYDLDVKGEGAPGFHRWTDSQPPLCLARPDPEPGDLQGIQASCPPDALCLAWSVTALWWLSSLQNLVEILCGCLLSWSLSPYSFTPLWLLSCYLVNLRKGEKTNAHGQPSAFNWKSYHCLFN